MNARKAITTPAGVTKTSTRRLSKCGQKICPMNALSASSIRKTDFAAIFEDAYIAVT
jgi:hypothetical protein